MNTLNRRALMQLSLAAGASAAPVARRKVITEQDPRNIKLAHRVSIRVSDEDLLFLKQIGLDHFRAEIPADAPLEELGRARDRFAKFGIRMISCAHYAHRTPDIELGLPGPKRERDLDKCRAVVRELGKLGVGILVLDWHPGNTYTTAIVERRGYRVREFNLAEYRAKMDDLTFGREYSVDEIWAALEYFLRSVLPVAEEVGVKLAMHPDDPPIPKMHGVPRIFSNAEGYRRAEKLAHGSKNWGVRLCVGTWSEGGKAMGSDVFEMIREWGPKGKIFDVDLRNVTSTLPVFQETFPDDGFVDLYQVVKALRQAGYSGPMVPDHVPELAGDGGDRRAATAYCIASMRAMLRRANEEAG
jgi:mannonate dehydratase